MNGQEPTAEPRRTTQNTSGVCCAFYASCFLVGFIKCQAENISKHAETTTASAAALLPTAERHIIHLTPSGQKTFKYVPEKKTKNSSWINFRAALDSFYKKKINPICFFYFSTAINHFKSNRRLID